MPKTLPVIFWPLQSISFTQQKCDIKCWSHVDYVKKALLKRLPVVCRHSMRKKKKKSQRAVKPHFICSMRRAVGLPSTSVPLSTVCTAQTWTNCPTFSPFLLFPSPPPFLCALSLRRPSLMAFFSLCPTLKKKKKNSGEEHRHVELFWYSGEQKWSERLRGGWGRKSLHGWCPFTSHCSFLPLCDPESWSPDGKNAAPECRSGPCLLQPFHSLIPVQHLLSSTRKYELAKRFYSSWVYFSESVCVCHV